MQHDFAPKYDYPSSMARRLARQGYPADTIYAGVKNYFGKAYCREAIEGFVRAERKRKPERYVDGAGKVHREDEEHLETMAAGSAVLLCQMWRAGLVGAKAVEPSAWQKSIHHDWMLRSRRLLAA